MTRLPLPPRLASDLQQVEQILAERTRSRAAVISVAGTRLLQPGSDRTRAALVLLAAGVSQYRLERVIHAAAAVELIYAATSTHDALIDEADRRRGTIRTGEWGHGVALMVGDYLFALAAGEMAQAPDPRVISYYAQAVMRISESALAPPPRVDQPDPARHLERLDGEASLVAAACRAGGACVGAPTEHLEALSRLGYAFGLALRLTTELRDFEEPVGDGQIPASLRSGVVTLPLLYAAQSGNAQQLAAAFDSGQSTALARVAEVVRLHGMGPTHTAIAGYLQEAELALATLPSGPGRDDLARAVRSLVHQ
ncbi:MAG: polyprenyl synthetase family protein [Chloroflexi bacterium OHK40]